MAEADAEANIDAAEIGMVLLGNAAEGRPIVWRPCDLMARTAADGDRKPVEPVAARRHPDRASTAPGSAFVTPVD
ncbi:MAG: hypothetical protein QF926_13420 [Alphaproteobacteria bacterium]|nr:hypothetical protein [Alphaproteobacteria bacterium]